MYEVSSFPFEYLTWQRLCLLSFPMKFLYGKFGCGWPKLTPCACPSYDRYVLRFWYRKCYMKCKCQHPCAYTLCAGSERARFAARVEAPVIAFSKALWIRFTVLKRGKLAITCQLILTHTENNWLPDKIKKLTIKQWQLLGKSQFFWIKFFTWQNRNRTIVEKITLPKPTVSIFSNYLKCQTNRRFLYTL